MKKNRMMRLASVLMVLTLLSTSVISGTFAKYITVVESSDSARVAKWGITMGLEEGTAGRATEVFVDKYDAIANPTVDGQGTDVVAPGTAGSVKYVVDGTPETDYKVTFKGTMVNEIYLGVGTYKYKAAAGDNVEYIGMDEVVTTNYYPLKWTVTVATTLGEVTGGWTAGTAQTFNTLDEAMDTLSDAVVTFDSNETCDLEVTVAWAWAFEGQDDQMDTILGDIIANNSDLTLVGADYSTNVGYTLEMTAEQID